MANSRHFNGPPLIQELEHVPFMRLVPGDFPRGDHADVQALDKVAVQNLLNEFRILRDRSDDQ